MAFRPYLFFGGNCREAFTRYQEVFGGELTLITFGDMPESDMPEANSPDKADWIAHAALMHDGQLLMGSDDPMADPFGPVQGMQVNCSVSSPEEAERVFAGLSEGGQAHMPIAPTSWSPAFGMCVDRFGTPWMVSADPTG